MIKAVFARQMWFTYPGIEHALEHIVVSLSTLSSVYVQNICVFANLSHRIWSIYKCTITLVCTSVSLYIILFLTTLR